MTWDSQLPGCMPGPFIAPFGGHPHDRRRVLVWAESLRQRNLGWVEAKRQIESYLSAHNASQAEIDQQVQRAFKLLKPLLPV